jgi:atypical dual specificity phosphatase
VHCQAGIGRTGTMLAAYLIGTGMSAEEAIAIVRRRNPHSVESDDQRTFLEQYAKSAG